MVRKIKKEKGDASKKERSLGAVKTRRKRKQREGQFKEQKLKKKDV